jgi:hypothetical protein
MEDWRNVFATQTPFGRQSWKNLSKENGYEIGAYLNSYCRIASRFACGIMQLGVCSLSIG